MVVGSFWSRINVVLFAILAIQFGYRAVRPNNRPDTATSMAWLAWQRNPSPETQEAWRTAEGAWREQQRVLRLQYAAVSVLASGVVFWMLLRKHTRSQAAVIPERASP